MPGTAAQSKTKPEFESSTRQEKRRGKVGRIEGPGTLLQVALVVFVLQMLPVTVATDTSEPDRWTQEARRGRRGGSRAEE